MPAWGEASCPPPESESDIKRLTRQGLTFLSQGQAVDIAVADQQRGRTTPCDWLETLR